MFFADWYLPRQNREGTRSIIECQNEVLRASLTTYELREEEIAAREESWKGNKAGLSKSLLEMAVALVSATKDYEIPAILLESIQKFFKVQNGILRLWLYRTEFERGSPLLSAFPKRLSQRSPEMPEMFIGENSGSEIASWFGVPISETKRSHSHSIKAPNGMTFGAICLASSDVSTFKASDVQDFLSGALPLAEAALLRV